MVLTLLNLYNQKYTTTLWNKSHMLAFSNFNILIWTCWIFNHQFIKLNPYIKEQHHSSLCDLITQNSYYNILESIKHNFCYTSKHNEEYWAFKNIKSVKTKPTACYFRSSSSLNIHDFLFVTERITEFTLYWFLPVQTHSSINLR